MKITFNDQNLEIFKSYVKESFSSLKFKVEKNDENYRLSVVNDKQASNGFAFALENLEVNIEEDMQLPVYFGININQKDSLKNSFDDALTLASDYTLSFGSQSCVVSVPASKLESREIQEMEEYITSNKKDVDAKDAIQIAKGSKLYELLKSLKDSIYIACKDHSISYKEGAYLVEHSAPVSGQSFSKKFTFIPVTVSGFNKVFNASCQNSINVGWDTSTRELYASAGNVTLRMIDYQDEVTTDIDYDADVKPLTEFPSIASFETNTIDYVKKLDLASNAVSTSYYDWIASEVAKFVVDDGNVNCVLNFGAENNVGKLPRDVQIKFDIASIKAFLNGSEKIEISYNSNDDGSIGKIKTEDSEIYIFAEAK